MKVYGMLTSASVLTAFIILSWQPDTPENGLDLLRRTTLMNCSELGMLITVLEARGLHAEVHTSLVYALFSTLANSNAHIPKHKII